MYKWSLASARIYMYTAFYIVHIVLVQPNLKQLSSLLLSQFSSSSHKKIHKNPHLHASFFGPFPPISSPAPAPKNRPLSDRPSPLFPTPGPDLHGTLNGAPGSSDLTATSIPRCDSATFLISSSSLLFSCLISYFFLTSLLLLSPARVGLTFCGFSIVFHV
ncbi:hypothetical protein GGI43DRAFT_69861 [Trichoderma evansii]